MKKYRGVEVKLHYTSGKNILTLLYGGKAPPVSTEYESSLGPSALRTVML
jgi:hypothetical protein